jgi:hypothetical protein
VRHHGVADLPAAEATRTAQDVARKTRTAIKTTAKAAAKLLKKYLEVTQEARAKKWPEMAQAIGGDALTWLNALPHHHPF